MTRDPVCVDPSTDIRELARIFDANEISGAPVLNASNRVIGVVARRMAEETVHRIIITEEHGRVLGIVTSLDLLRAFPE